MGNIDRLVKVDIVLNTTPLTRAGFNTVLILGPHVRKLGRVLSYNSLEAMEQDGFTTDDVVYKAAKAGFNQTPKPSAIKIGKIICDKSIVNTAKVSDAASYTIAVESVVNGSVVSKEYEFISGTGATTATILAGLAGVITADGTAIVTGVVANDLLEITNKTAGTEIAVKLSSNLKQNSVVAGTDTLVDTLTAVTAYDNDWYGLALTSHVQADILAVAEWVESKTKLFGTSVSEAGAKSDSSTTDTLAKLKEAGYLRTFPFFHEKDDEYIEVAEFVRCLYFTPGSETWANKKLERITADGLTETESQAIRNKNGSTYESFGNISITQGGKVSGGEWIDIIRFRDWLKDAIQKNVLNLKISVPKIPFTDGGIALVTNQITSALKEGQDNGGIAPNEFFEDGSPNQGFLVTAPLSANISAQDKTARTLRGVEFRARLAGAIHMTEIFGSLGYDNFN